MKFYRLDSHLQAPRGSVRRLKWQPRKGYGPDCVEPQAGAYKAQVLERSRKWYDILSTTESLVKLWSERAKLLTELNLLVGLEFCPVEFVYFEDKRLLKRAVPQFYIVKYLHGVPATPYERDDTTPCRFDSRTGLYDLGEYFGVQKYVFDFTKWDGADFFYISTVYTAHRFCSQRFKDIVEEHDLTNFVFNGANDEEGTEFFI
jgi:hypothetical protein